MIFIPQLGIGGTEKHVNWLINELNNYYSFTILVQYSGGYWEDKIKVSGASIISSTEKNRCKWATSIVTQLWRLGKIDIFHSFGYGDHFIDILLIAFLKNPIIIKSTRNNRHWDKRLKLQYSERVRNMFVDIHLVNSRTVKNTLHNIENIPNNKIIQIDNYVPKVIPRSEERVYKSACIKLLMVSNFKTVKNNIEAIKILKALTDKQYSCELTIIGSGDQKLINECKKYLQTEKLEKIVMIREEDPDRIPEYIKLSDIYISTSLSEGASNSLMEAVNFGLPFVSTDTGNALELIEKGVVGFTYKVRDIDDAVEKCLTLISLVKDNYHEMIKSNQSIMNEYYSHEKIKAEYICFYRGLLA